MRPVVSTSGRRRPAAAVTVVLLIGAVGWLDLVTGTEVRVLALYFLPLLLAGWTLGVGGAALAALLATGVWIGALVLARVQYSQGYIWAVNALTEGLGFVIVAVLVAKLRESLDRERTLSRTDPLTGLYNRRAMLENAARAWAVCARHGRAMSVICLDLNNFKTANDRRGHHFGDLLLKEGAAILLATTRSGDIVARTGGDEFVIVLPEAGVEQARALVIRIEAAFAALSLFADVGVGVSAGVAGEERLSAELPELLRCADDRMYEAKRGVKASLVAHAPQRGGPA